MDLPVLSCMFNLHELHQNMPYIYILSELIQMLYISKIKRSENY